MKKIAETAIWTCWAPVGSIPAQTGADYGESGRVTPFSRRVSHMTEEVGKKGRRLRRAIQLEERRESRREHRKAEKKHKPRRQETRKQGKRDR